MEEIQSCTYRVFFFFFFFSFSIYETWFETTTHRYASRSRALCVKGEYALALTDANVCIAIDVGGTGIGYCCKGQALLHMRQFNTAEKAFKRALACDDSNTEAIKGVQNAQEKLCE